MPQVRSRTHQSHLIFYTDNQNRCGEAGHKARECPTDPEGPMKCFNCGQEGYVTISITKYSPLIHGSTAMQRAIALIPESSLAPVVVVKRKDTRLRNAQTSLQSSALTAKKRVELPCLYDSILSNASARPLSI